MIIIITSSKTLQRVVNKPVFALLKFRLSPCKGGVVVPPGKTEGVYCFKPLQHVANKPVFAPNLSPPHSFRRGGFRG